MRILFLLLLLPLFGQAQNTSIKDTSSINLSADSSKMFVKRSTIMSAALPGLGQGYNKKYWKIPIIYSSLGACVYFIKQNTDSLNHFRNGLIAELDEDPLTSNTTRLTGTSLNQAVDTYNKWRDISWMCLAGVYILQIIDANVGAHLNQFDVNENLSLNYLPYFNPTRHNSAGIRLTLNF